MKVCSKANVFTVLLCHTFGSSCPQLHYYGEANRDINYIRFLFIRFLDIVRGKLKGKLSTNSVELRALKAAPRTPPSCDHLPLQQEKGIPRPMMNQEECKAQ